MATVRLSDAVIPEVYETYGRGINNPELTALFDSGIIRQTEQMNRIARAGGKTGTIPFWLDLDPTIEENQSNDDPADYAVPNKLGSTTMTYRKCWVNQAYSAMDLVAELAGSDPMQRIRSRFGVYWSRRDQRRLIATIKGILADNIANDAGDMVVDISAVGNGLPGAEAIIDAQYTMGDMVGSFVATIMHSNVVKRLEKQDLIDTIPDSKGNNLQYFRGLRVIKDDSMPVMSGTGADSVYLTVFFGGGSIGLGEQAGHAFAEGEGVPANPTYVIRDELSGNGGGGETMGERRTLIMHPFGFRWIEDPSGTTNDLVEFSPTNADLANAAHWDRVVARKQVPMAFMLSKA